MDYFSFSSLSFSFLLHFFCPLLLPPHFYFFLFLFTLPIILCFLLSFCFFLFLLLFIIFLLFFLSLYFLIFIISSFLSGLLISYFNFVHHIYFLTPNFSYIICSTFSFIFAPSSFYSLFLSFSFYFLFSSSLFSSFIYPLIYLIPFLLPSLDSPFRCLLLPRFLYICISFFPSFFLILSDCLPLFLSFCYFTFTILSASVSFPPHAAQKSPHKQCITTDSKSRPLSRALIYSCLQ